MEPYRVAVRRSASRELEQLPPTIGRRVAAAIDSLVLNPRPRGSMKLRDAISKYRLRIGAYRVLYEIDDTTRTVWVYAVRHRREAYR